MPAHHSISDVKPYISRQCIRDDFSKSLEAQYPKAECVHHMQQWNEEYPPFTQNVEAQMPI